MVKNDAGGNKGKGLARKHVNAAKCGGSKQLRVAIDEAEQYGVVSKMLGNGMCYVRLLSSGNGNSKDNGNDNCNHPNSKAKTQTTPQV